MGSAIGRGCVALACALSVGLLAAPCSFGTGNGQRGTLAEFKVAGSNGYQLDVQAHNGSVRVLASAGRSPEVTIGNSGEIIPASKGNTIANFYNALGTATPGTIEADLGELGEISVAFHPSGETRVTNVKSSRKARRCTPRKVVRHLGVFTGTIRFRGEGGYTSADLTSAPGSVGVRPFQGCSPKITGVGQSPGVSVSDHVTTFSAIDGHRPVFTVTTVESLGQSLMVSRFARTVGDAKSFVSGHDFRSIGVTPPPPFSGGATLRHAAAHHPTWSGDLSVSFPGKPDVPLTGASFHGHLIGANASQPPPHRSTQPTR